ncbi:MAG: hypothetical protein GY796_02590, partial [Chloroflexi bacterium]|nr:hypothetical protein [Chloroflexota bacterium]
MQGQERFLLAGIDVHHSDPLVGGEKLMSNGQKVGAVNSPAWSHRMQKSLALVHLHPDNTAPGTPLDVVGDDVTYTITVRYASPDNSPAQGIIVTDDHYGVASYMAGDTDNDGLLDV